MIFFIALIFCLVPLLIILRKFQQMAKITKENFVSIFSQKEKEYLEKEGKLKQIKEEISFKEKEIGKILHLYEIVRKMVKILNWEEMLKFSRQAIKEYLNLQEFLFFVPGQKNNFSLVFREGLFLEEGWVQEHFSDYLTQEKVKIVSLPEGERLLFLPFKREEELLSVLWAKLTDTIKPDSLKEKELLEDSETLVNQLVLGLEKTKLYSEVEEKSRFDGLTGLYRRHYFEMRLEEEILRAKRYGTSFSLVFVDIDYFKKLNDTYGHYCGDQILHRLGIILRESVYETDIVARYGGEEFVLLLPRAEPEGVKRKMENLREKIATEEFILDWGKLKITVSIGLAHYPKDGSTAEEIIRAADQALYFSKEKGRNCLTEYSQLKSGVI